jgi:predicted N-acyltransferase
VLINALQRTENGAQRVIAAALFMRDSTTLYGRYWGCFEEYQFLHFETCYYQGIDYAIANRLTRFDGGAQGEHKIARGFEPVITHSNHWIKEPGFRNAIEQFLQQESKQIHLYAEQAAQSLPFK